MELTLRLYASAPIWAKGEAPDGGGRAARVPGGLQGRGADGRGGELLEQSSAMRASNM